MVFQSPRVDIDIGNLHLQSWCKCLHSYTLQEHNVLPGYPLHNYHLLGEKRRRNEMIRGPLRQTKAKVSQQKKELGFLSYKKILHYILLCCITLRYIKTMLCMVLFVFVFLVGSQCSLHCHKWPIIWLNGYISSL